ncbi:hypothetical protein [Candidatus Puniceispirillum marinum]|uniref:Uncharacterized protein n=1 Tax=Puniceispirillum marinum (strain IMCC1322) TaxID=488538 RepID=D5BSE2_PUNMI|nr:hypothetical protein [Candidatus Puniceispirillum marinum]ADE39189.1 hypothetical protein SAR116_0946 [Candidatus Puniceispirillum marinum IMCC1322]
MEQKLARKVEDVLKMHENKSKQDNLDEAERLDEKFENVEPDPFRYSIEQAIGLPAFTK